MNTKNIYLLTVAVLSMLAGCTVDEELEQMLVSGTAGDEPVPVTFCVSEKLSLTRAATNIVTFNNNEDIKVFVKPAGQSDYTGYTYKTSTADPAQSNVSLTAPATPPYFPAGPNSQVQAYAYYPATAGEEETFSVMDNQMSDANYKASDLMFASNRTITKGNSAGTNLDMQHLMAQLHLNVTGIATTVNRVLVYAKRSVTFNSAAGTASLTGDASNITAATAAGHAYLCIPPQPINSIAIKVETGEQNDAATTATFTFTSTSNFVAGSTYPINLTVSATQVGTTTTIEDWDGAEIAVVADSLTVGAVTTEYTYDGTQKHPTPAVSYGDIPLTLGSDYLLCYGNNVNAGDSTAVVIAKGIGLYAGILGSNRFSIAKGAGFVTLNTNYGMCTAGKACRFNVVTNHGGDLSVAVVSGTALPSDPTLSEGIVNFTSSSTSNTTTTIRVTCAETDNYNEATADFVLSTSVRLMSSAKPDDVGKIIASDGNIYNSPSEIVATDASISGIIAYVNANGTASNTCPDVSGSYRGLVLARKNANGFKQMPSYTSANGNCVSPQSADWSTAIKFYNGIDHTNTLVSDGHIHFAALICRNHYDVRPSGSSDWFLPSIGQWNLMIKALVAKGGGSNTNLEKFYDSAPNTHGYSYYNNILLSQGAEVIHSGSYWSSSEASNAYTWEYSSTRGYVRYSYKNYRYFVRAVFAF